MAIITSGKIFNNGEQLTADKMNQMFTSASFDTAGAIDSGSMQVLTDGSLSVKDGGITPTKISAGGPSWTSDGKTTNISGDGVDAYLELNGGTGSTNGIAAIDFHSTNATNPDYDGSIRHFQSNFIHQTMSSGGEHRFMSSADATPDVTPTGIVQTGTFRAAQGVPGSADSSTTGFAFGPDGDTGMFCVNTTGAAAGGPIAFYANNVENMRINGNGGFTINKEGTSQALAQFATTQGGEARSLTINTPADTSTNSPFVFSTGNSISFEIDASEAMRIDSNGRLIISNIPTSASGLSSGTVYSDSGTLKIVS